MGRPPHDPRPSAHARGERLIAGGRVVLAAGSLLAIWLDPTEPAKHAGTAHALMAAYLLYAIALAAVVFGARAPLRGLQLVTHVLDLALFLVFMWLTEGPSSPFFVYIVFSVVCATIRWHLKGAAITGAVAIAAFTALGLWGASAGQPAFALNRFLIRDVHLVVLTVLVAVLGVFEERAQREIASLASWPRVAREGRSLVADSLAHAAELLGAPRAVLVWEEAEEPWVNVAAWSPAGFESTREAPGTYEPLVAPGLESADFIRDVGVEGPSAFVAEDGRLVHSPGEPCHPELVARFRMGSVIALVIEGDELGGRLFLLDRRRVTSDDMHFGRIAAETVAALLAQMTMSRRLATAAEDETRVRLARDLHDGLLQSLTGASLQLRSMRSLAVRDPAALPARLAEIEHAIVSEQRELRIFIDELWDPLESTCRHASLSIL